jgi:hypothetical protein
MARLTKELIRKVPLPAKGSKVYWDDQLKGFGLRVTAIGKKVFTVKQQSPQGCRPGIGSGAARPVAVMLHYLAAVNCT